MRAAVRTWTNIEGVKIQADFIKAEGDTVTLRLVNGKQVSFSQAKLSAEDRKFIRTASPQAASENPPSKASSTNSNRTAKWQTTMTRAKNEARDTGLPILVLFTGTSWCPYCIKLEKEIFDKKEFKEFANQNLVLLKLEFEAGGKPKNKANAELAQSFGVQGYPTYFLTDEKGKTKAGGGYYPGLTPESFAAWVRSVSK